MRVYHVTPTSNLESIQEHGLQPRIGPLAQLAGETEPRIYVFCSLEAMTAALDNWLGDAMGDVPLSAIALDMPYDKVERPLELYEAYAVSLIPPHCIQSIVDLETCVAFPSDFQP